MAAFAGGQVGRRAGAQAGRRTGGRAGWLAGWVAGWLPGCLAAWLPARRLFLLRLGSLRRAKASKWVADASALYPDARCRMVRGARRGGI